LGRSQCHPLKVGFAQTLGAAGALELVKVPLRVDLALPLVLERGAGSRRYLPAVMGRVEHVGANTAA
jgi:hypothetical protein